MLLNENLFEDENVAEPTQEASEADYVALFQQFLEENTPGFFQKDEGKDYYKYVLYADYKDYIEAGDAYDIVNSDNPSDAFYDAFDKFYDYSNEEDYILQEFNDYLKDKNMPELDWEDFLFKYELNNFYSIEPDYDHFGRVEYNCRIVVDTGDGNYDFTLNPSYYNNYQGSSESGDENGIGNPASLVWLAETQGYSLEQLKQALSEGDISNPSGFLQSVRQEAVNVTSSMNALTFLCKATLDDLIMFKEDKARGQGVLVVPSNCVSVGLFDMWNGGGSTLEIQLEKDVRIPSKYVREFNVDANSKYTYSVDDVYGLSSAAYKTRVMNLIESLDNEKSESTLTEAKAEPEKKPNKEYWQKVRDAVVGHIDGINHQIAELDPETESNLISKYQDLLNSYNTMLPELDDRIKSYDNEISFDDLADAIRNLDINDELVINQSHSFLDNSKMHIRRVSEVRFELWDTGFDGDEEVIANHNIYSDLENAIKWAHTGFRSVDCIKKNSTGLTESVESTNESLSGTPELGPESGVAALINKSIVDEWNTIQSYNDAIVMAETEGYSDIAQVLRDIVNEENIHVGQLEKCMEQLAPTTSAIEQGEVEASAQLNNNEDINEDLNPTKWYVYMDSPYASAELIGSADTKEEAEKIKAEKDKEWRTGYLWRTYITDKPIEEKSLGWD